MASPADGERSGLVWLLPALAVFGSAAPGLALWQFNSAALPEGTDLGLEAFRRAGCASCHGSNGGGGQGPAMAGHEAEQVVRQVRAPFGAMPLFTCVELDDQRLGLIVQFVVGLDSSAGGAGHDRGRDTTSAISPRGVLIGRHWMAQQVIVEGDAGEAAYQISHLDDVVSGEHKVAMGEVLGFLGATDLLSRTMRHLMMRTCRAWNTTTQSLTTDESVTNELTF